MQTKVTYDPFLKNVSTRQPLAKSRINLRLNYIVWNGILDFLCVCVKEFGNLLKTGTLLSIYPVTSIPSHFTGLKKPGLFTFCSKLERIRFETNKF